MKITQRLAMVLAVAILALGSGCKKETVEGPQGPKGDPGNANVKVFNYGSRTFSGSQSYIIPNISQETLDKSMVLAYYNPATESATSWYPVPGMGPSSAYDTRYFLNKEEGSSPDILYNIRLLNPTNGSPYTESVTYTKFRIFVVPASSSTNLESPMQGTPDLYDYYAVKSFYNIED